MYTTLSLLRQENACTDGFRRQLQFWGATPETKGMKIPLHALSLIGIEDDVDWITENGLIIDMEEFQTLFDETALQLFYYQLSTHHPACFSYGTPKKAPIKSRGVKPPPQPEKEPPVWLHMLERLRNVRSLPELKSLLQDARAYSVLDWPGKGLCQDNYWHRPNLYIRKLWEVCGRLNSKGYHHFGEDEDEVPPRDLFADRVKVQRNNRRLAFAQLLQPIGTYDFIFQMTLRTKPGLIVNKDDRTVTLRSTDDMMSFYLVMSAMQGVQNALEANSEYEAVFTPELRRDEAVVEAWVNGPPVVMTATGRNRTPTRGERALRRTAASVGDAVGDDSASDGSSGSGT